MKELPNIEETGKNEKKKITNLSIKNSFLESSELTLLILVNDINIYF